MKVPEAAAFAAYGMIALSLGCGDDTEPIVDSGALADAEVIARDPDIDWLSDGSPPGILRPCPDGWRASDGEAGPECEPLPPIAAACASGQVLFPGAAGCEPLGAPCPSGEFASDLPADTVYVSASAAAGGDGSLAAPYRTLSEVPFRSLGEGDTVAVGRGTHTGPLFLDPGVRVVGACAEETILVGEAGPFLAAVNVTAAGPAVTLEDLTLAGAPQTAIRVDAGEAIVLRRVVVARAPDVGLSISGPGASATLERVVVRDTLPGSSDTGFGAQVADGASLVASQVIFEGNTMVGVLVEGEGSAVTLRDAVIRDTHSRSDGELGRGVNIQDGARVSMERSVVEDNLNTGIFVDSPGSVLELTDVVIRRTAPRELDGQRGRGISVQDGAALTGTRVALEDNHEYGLFANDEGTTVTLTDSVVRRNVTISGTFGRGIESDDGSEVTLDRVLLTQNEATQIYVGAGVVTARDLVIRDTRPPANEVAEGHAVSARFGGTFAGERVLVERVSDVSIVSTEAGSRVTLVDAVVRETLREISIGNHGYGLIAQTGAIDLERVRVEGALGVGAFAFDRGVITGSDVQVLDVVSNDRSIFSFGYGLAAVGGTIELDGFSVTAAEVCGVFLADWTSNAPSASLAHGVVSGTAIGACVQSDGFDVSSLSNDVAYRDNGINLDATELPVPGAPTFAQGNGG